MKTKVSQQNYYADTNLDGLMNSVSLSLNPSWNKLFFCFMALIVEN